MTTRFGEPLGSRLSAGWESAVDGMGRVAGVLRPRQLPGPATIAVILDTVFRIGVSFGALASRR